VEEIKNASNAQMNYILEMIALKHVLIALEINAIFMEIVKMEPQIVKTVNIMEINAILNVTPSLVKNFVQNAIEMEHAMNVKKANIGGLPANINVNIALKDYAIWMELVLNQEIAKIKIILEINVLILAKIILLAKNVIEMEPARNAKMIYILEIIALIYVVIALMVNVILLENV
jgi:hypothetical protein